MNRMKSYIYMGLLVVAGGVCEMKGSLTTNQFWTKQQFQNYRDTLILQLDQTSRWLKIEEQSKAPQVIELSLSAANNTDQTSSPSTAPDEQRITVNFAPKAVHSDQVSLCEHNLREAQRAVTDLGTDLKKSCSSSQLQKDFDHCKSALERVSSPSNLQLSKKLPEHFENYISQTATKEKELRAAKTALMALGAVTAALASTTLQSSFVCNHLLPALQGSQLMGAVGEQVVGGSIAKGSFAAMGMLGSWVQSYLFGTPVRSALVGAAVGKIVQANGHILTDSLNEDEQRTTVRKWGTFINMVTGVNNIFSFIGASFSWAASTGATIVMTPAQLTYGIISKLLAQKSAGGSGV